VTNHKYLDKAFTVVVVVVVVVVVGGGKALKVGSQLLFRDAKKPGPARRPARAWAASRPGPVPKTGACPGLGNVTHGQAG